MFSAIKLWVEENWPREADPFIESRDGIITVKYDDVKWYDDFDYVKDVWAAIERFEAAFNTEDFETHRAHWEYARVGEGISDLDTGGSAYHHYRVGIRREIVID
jgi:hypothetical protein